MTGDLGRSGQDHLRRWFSSGPGVVSPAVLGFLLPLCHKKGCDVVVLSLGAPRPTVLQTALKSSESGELAHPFAVLGVCLRNIRFHL